MGAARKPKKAPATPSKETDPQAAVEHVAGMLPAVTGLDGDAGVPMEEIGEIVAPAKPVANKAAKPKTARAQVREHVKKVRAANDAAHARRMDACAQAAEAAAGRAPVDVSAVDFTNITGVEPAAARAYAELLASGKGVTPRESETATGLNVSQRCKVDRRLGKAGYRLHYEPNPERDRADRHTANRYYLTRR
jgi:hypothetical protein